MTVSRQWMPRSLECLNGYTARHFTHDLVAGSHGRPRRTAASNGLRHRLRCLTTSRSLHSGRRRISDFSPWRLADSDRRPDRRLRRHRRRHRPQVWSIRPRAGRNDGGRSAARHGPDGTWNGGQVHSAPGDDWLHEWHRPADCLDANQRLLRLDDSVRAERLRADGRRCSFATRAPSAGQRSPCRRPRWR